MTRSLHFAIVSFFCSFALVAAASAQIADLSVSKTGPAMASAGSDITYTIHLFNSGPEASVIATLTDRVPDGTTFVSKTAPAAWSCSDPDPQTNNNTLVCTNNSVPVGADDVFTFVVHINPEIEAGTTITNGVQVTTPPDPDTGSRDPNEENNTAFANTMIPGGAVADLDVTKSVDSDQALPDTDATFTISVLNRGPDAAPDATLTDTLPNNMTFVSLAAPQNWNCSTPAVGAGGTITCSTTNLPANTTSTFTLVGHIPSNAMAEEVFSNVASVSSSSDFNPENDSASASVAVVAAAPSLTTAASSSVLLGGTISDTATLSGGFNPTGTITFYLYGPDDSSCSSAPAASSSVDVNNGNGQYNSGGFVPGAPGTYRFVASYSGDTKNKSITTVCNDPNESVVVTAPTPSPTPTATATATATPTATATATPTPTPTATPAQALNISTRLRVEAGDRAMIGGFIIRGNVPKPVVLRGLGPSLMVSGLPGMMVLADPFLELHGPSGALITTNDNWKDSPQRSQFEGTVYQPSDDKESVIVATLTPGNYTGVLRGVGETSGIGLVEVYDNGSTVDSDLANISTRGFVRTGNEVMIGGFTLGRNQTATRVAIRARGPSLASSGLTQVLADPTLELRDANGNLIIANDDWGSDSAQAAQLTANGLALPDPKESGIFVSLPPGQFTAIVAGKNGGIGTALVEIYNVR
jgi:uncharacterized repeat protein (TIGR01451 family)